MSDLKKKRMLVAPTAARACAGRMVLTPCAGRAWSRACAGRAWSLARPPEHLAGFFNDPYVEVMLIQDSSKSHENSLIFYVFMLIVKITTYSITNIFKLEWIHAVSWKFWNWILKVHALRNMGTVFLHTSPVLLIWKMRWEEFNCVFSSNEVLWINMKYTIPIYFIWLICYYVFIFLNNYVFI